MRDYEYKNKKHKFTENTGNPVNISVCKGNEHLKKILNDYHGERVKHHKEPCIQISVSNKFSAGGHGSGSVHIPCENLLEFIAILQQLNEEAYSPCGILQTTKPLTEKEYQRLKAAWNNRHKVLTQIDEDDPPMDQRYKPPSICGESGYWCMSALCKRCAEMGTQ